MSVDTGDLDGDGHADVLIGAPGINAAGYVSVYSGKTGKVLLSVKGVGALEYLGTKVAFVGDADKDGTLDIAASGQNHPLHPAKVFSGKNGKLLHSLTTPGYGSGTSCISAAGDLNGDGHADILVGFENYAKSCAAEGRVIVFSGKDRKILLDVTGGVGDHLGSWVRSVGDLNRDGVPDVIAGAHQLNSRSRQC
ncbi:MAG: FG-GAP-like repeat-containing protein [Planctomycetota bacterium]